MSLEQGSILIFMSYINEFIAIYFLRFCLKKKRQVKVENVVLK